MPLIKRQVSAAGMRRPPTKPSCHYREIHFLALFIFINFCERCALITLSPHSIFNYGCRAFFERPPNVKIGFFLT